MNTDCSRCMFFNDNDCFFNIRELVSNKFNIVDSNIENYYCSYGFGTETYQNNMYVYTKEQIVNEIVEKNKLHYLLYITMDYSSDLTEVVEKINNLDFVPEYLCIYCKSINPEHIEEFNSNIKKEIKWRISHKGDYDSTNFDIFLGICGAFLNESKNNMLVINQNQIDNIDNIINEVHIDSKILYCPTIRISNDLDIIFVPTTQLTHLNFEELFNNTIDYIRNINYTII